MQGIGTMTACLPAIAPAKPKQSVLPLLSLRGALTTRQSVSPFYHREEPQPTHLFPSAPHPFSPCGGQLACLGCNATKGLPGDLYFLWVLKLSYLGLPVTQVLASFLRFPG
jgi:hypothetical protein